MVQTEFSQLSNKRKQGLAGTTAVMRLRMH